MQPIMEQYEILPTLEEALRRRICSVCIDQKLDGSCGRDAQHECTLFSRLPEIAYAVSKVKSNRVDDYVTALRQYVCATCPHQDAEGICEEREAVQCALDRYIGPIVETIEEIRGVVLTPGRLLATH